MKIGIDCRTILHPGVGEQAGVGHYTYYLVKNLLQIDQKNHYVLFFDSRFKATKEFEQDNVTIRHFPFYQYKKYLPLTYTQLLVSAVIKKEKLDVYHSPANIIPVSYKRPTVVTVHDLAVYKHPNLFPKSLINRQVFTARNMMPTTITRASAVISVSKNTKTDIIEEFGVAEEKINVVYHGVLDKLVESDQIDFSHIKKKYHLSDKYILFIGTIEPRKNILALIKAYRNLRLAYDSPIKDCDLVVAGASGRQMQGFYSAVIDANASLMGDDKIDITDKNQVKSKLHYDGKTPVKYLGYVPHQDKLALLRHAKCFVFPSLYEGFGLPVLEAMSLGVPVITSNVSSIPEVVGESGALMVNPYKETEIYDAIYDIMVDDGLSELLSIKGKDRAKEFSWHKCAQETLAVYQRVVDRR